MWENYADDGHLWVLFDVGGVSPENRLVARIDLSRESIWVRGQFGSEVDLGPRSIWVLIFQ